MHLRSPIFGNKFYFNQNSNIRRTLDGTLIINNGVNNVTPDSRFPILQGFQVVIKALDKSLRDQLITYFKGAAGQELTLKDHENRVWTGFITSDPEIKAEGKEANCLYSVSFGFDGIPA